MGRGTPVIEILLGADIYPSILTGEIRKLRSGPTAIHTKLGWTLLGSVKNTAQKLDHFGYEKELREHSEPEYKHGLHTMNSLCVSKHNTDHMISLLWELEALGISDPVTKKNDTEIDAEVRKYFLSTLTKSTTGRYSIRLPWREDQIPLPSNKEVVKNRLVHTAIKLIQGGLFETYSKIFEDWEHEGIIENITDFPTNEDARIHYLMHRAVIKIESTTTPVRPVFNASFRVGKNPSLNDCLHKGENMIQRIPEVLLRFREKRVGFVSDVRKAFQMIDVTEKDRDVLRFLWWKDSSMQKIVEYRHARVPFGVNCSPFLLAMVLFSHLTNLDENKKTCGTQLLKRLYVDNCVGCESTLLEYEEFRTDAIEIFNRAGMELRMWMSNTDKKFDEVDKVIPVLGILWDREKDELFVNVKNIHHTTKYTKRNVLSITQQIFDPIGFTAPALLMLKLLIQRLWLKKLKWDEAIPKEETIILTRFIDEIKILADIRAPRVSTAGVNNKENWSLHTFTDASKDAFGVVIYLRVEKDNEVSIQLVIAKSRVSPKNVTIPRLELMGCLIGARLANTVSKALELESVQKIYWTDSMCAKAWISREDVWATFVANRTKEIRELTQIEQWRHVPGIHNPADIASRGCYPSQLISSNWVAGPKWLYKENHEWPMVEESVNESEIKNEQRKSVVCSMTNIVKFDFTSKSLSYSSRVRVVAWVRRFLHNKLLLGCEKKRGPLEHAELERAELVLIRNLQRDKFPPNERERLKCLEIIEDSWGILRVKTRLTYGSDLETFKYPVLLPSDHELVHQLICDTHKNYCHGGTGFLLCKLRQKFWILQARRTIKRVIKRCVKCQRFTSKSVIGEPSPLPLNRIKDAEVFEVVGVDLAGPLLLKNGSKVWILIVTCAVYRAVHFELVNTISARAFVKALGKFIRKFRRPTIIYCDNGTNFHGANNMFKRFNWSEITETDGVKQINFKFNPVTPSWWGGWWERLIRSAKDLLKRTLGNKCVTRCELESVMDTIADTMNERPLTYVTEDSNDLEPLTPSLFLHPFGSCTFPEEKLIEGDKLRYRIKYVRQLKEELKKRFRDEYLSMLVNRKPKKTSEKLKVGDIVYIGRDDVKRVMWPLARVIGLLPRPDGHCRLVTLKTKDGICNRSIQRLYPLELDNHDPMRQDVRKKAVVTRAGRVVKFPAKYQE